MGSVSYKVAAPGSLMLFGEHAVLHGKESLVAAIDRHIKIKLIPRADNKIKITSKEFGNYITSLDKFKTIKKYDYALEAVRQNLNKIKSGFTLEISSDFSSTVGLGSSAAVIVATLSILDLWLGKKKIDPIKIYQQGVKVVHSIQGIGSGADIAASVFGGIISYKIKPTSIKKIADSLPLVAVYSGSKLKTKEVIAKVEAGRKKSPNIYSEIYRSIDICSKKAINAIKKKNWKMLGELANIHQGLQDALGVNNKILSELIFSLRSQSNIYGAKISGSGLGDCIIGIGKIKKNSFPENKKQKETGVKQIDFKVSKKGIHVIR